MWGRRGVVLLVMLAAACVSATVERIGPPRPATRVDHVQVIWDQPTRPFEVIGVIAGSADINVDPNKFDGKFRKEAAKLGGDAVLYSTAGAGLTGGTVGAMPGYAQGRTAYIIVWKDSTKRSP